MWISGLVLLIACANIANLLLVRGMGRKSEMSCAPPSGPRAPHHPAAPHRELVLSTLGGMAGLVVAYLGSRALLVMAFPGAQNVPIDAHPSLPVLSLCDRALPRDRNSVRRRPGLDCGPIQPADALRTGSRTTATRASLLQRSLVVFQAALSLVLLIGAGLFAQSLNKLQSIDLKLDSKNRYIVHINPQAAGYSPSQLAPLYRAFEDRFHAVPGVVHVSISTYTPMEDNNWGSGIQSRGQPEQYLWRSHLQASLPNTSIRSAHPCSAAAPITPQDYANLATVAIVNRTS